MIELRPISLCNEGYKIISKVLCQRLNACLLLLISETQSVFLPGKLISDNILITQEMFHGLRASKSCQDKLMAIKMDMSKAYDRVEWKFIQEILYKMGFEHHWTKNNDGMYLFVQSLIKWSTKRTHNSRGLCQGYSLSPYLFIMYTCIDCKY